MELFLNIVWLSIGIVAFAAAPRRSVRALLALAGALVLLFPIVSVSDDLSGNRDALEEALAVITAIILLLISLIAIARVEAVPVVRAALVVAVQADPRSPPAR